MTTCNVMIVGFGGVGQAFASILQDQITSGSDTPYRVVAVADLHHGWAYDDQGLDLLALMQEDTRVQIMNPFTDDALGETLALIRESGIQVLVEATYTTHDGEPALSYFKTALSSGAHVITTNKGPVSVAMKDLEQLADANSVSLMAEGSVMSGTPVLSVLDAMPKPNSVTKIRGIFNGTCNYILTQIRGGMSYDQALEQARELGFAEADPTNDVEGWDVALKMLILSNRYMGTSLTLEDIAPKGISLIDADEYQMANDNNQRWRLIGEIRNEEGKTSVSVGPELVSEDDPLFFIDGAVNAINIECDYLGSFTISGPGAGLPETAYALWSDLNAVWRP